ncbi:MAG: hypothetical protein AB1489_39910 [Acidobacteriota bacterium]
MGKIFKIGFVIAFLLLPSQPFEQTAFALDPMRRRKIIIWQVLAMAKAAAAKDNRNDSQYNARGLRTVSGGRNG